MFKTLFYQPMVNILIMFYNIFHDLGFSAIALITLVRLILWPLFTKNETSQKIIAKIQPEVSRIQKENGKNYQKQSQDLLALYKKYKINPSFTMIFSIIQIFFILGLYNTFNIVAKPTFVNYLYGFLKHVTTINYNAFGFINLVQPNLFLAIIASATQLIQGWLMLRNTGPKDPQRGSLIAITVVMPIILLSIYQKLPALIYLY
jgi:YidC/Oxa1 family membrane protein insertase